MATGLEDMVSFFKDAFGVFTPEEDPTFVKAVSKQDFELYKLGKISGSSLRYTQTGIGNIGKDMIAADDKQLTAMLDYEKAYLAQVSKSGGYGNHGSDDYGRSIVGNGEKPIFTPNMAKKTLLTG